MAEDKLQLFNMPSNIKGMVLIYNNLYALCENSIHKVQTGTMIDIHNEYEKVPSTNIQMISNGGNRAIIVEIWQIMQKLEKMELSDKNRQNIKMRYYFCDVKKNLLDIIENISNFINTYEKLSLNYTQEYNKTTQTITEDIITDHPFIPNLNNEVKTIIVDIIGGLLNKLAQLILNVYIFELSSTHQNKIMSKDKYLNNAIGILKEKEMIQDNSLLLEYVNTEYNNFLTRLVIIRNKIEHPNRNENVEIVNFFIQPNGSFGLPYWNLNINKYKGSYLLMDELNSIYLNFLKFIENFIKILVNEKFNF